MKFYLLVAFVQCFLGNRQGELFAEFDDKPLAAASLGQVHRAKTKDGIEMAIKIQRDNLKENSSVAFYCFLLHLVAFCCLWLVVVVVGVGGGPLFGW